MDVEKEKDFTEQEVQRLQQLLQDKRSRTHVTTDNVHEECYKKSSDDCGLADYRRETTHIQKHHSVALDSHEDVPTPQKGHVGPLDFTLDHSRLGFVGWIVRQHFVRPLRR